MFACRREAKPYRTGYVCIKHPHSCEQGLNLSNYSHWLYRTKYNKQKAWAHKRNTDHMNTYILPWSAGETLRTELSLLTFVSLFRVRLRRKRWGTCRIDKAFKNTYIILHHGNIINFIIIIIFTLYTVASPQLMGNPWGHQGQTWGITISPSTGFSPLAKPGPFAQ